MNEISMKFDEVVGKVTTYLASNTSIARDVLKDPEHTLDDQGMDSLQLIQLVIWIESETDKPVVIDQLFSDTDFSVTTIARYICDSEGFSE